MNVWLALVMVFLTLGLAMALIVRVAWQFWYYIIAAKNPIGKTLATGIAALWLMCAGLLAIV